MVTFFIQNERYIKKAPANKKAEVCNIATLEENTETSLVSLGSLGYLNVGERERHPCGVCAAFITKTLRAYMVTLFYTSERVARAPPGAPQ